MSSTNRRQYCQHRPVDWIGGSRHSYGIVCVCLVVLAAVLRFYELSVNSLWLDEAALALFVRGTFFESWDMVREGHSAPPLYPLVLWLVQKVESSAFSVRLVPAAASVLVVAGILLLLPRFVGRWSAFQTALLFTFSAEAIRQARDAREYSIDAFVAVLILVGLLSMVRGGRGEAQGEAGGCKLLCIALFVAPLVQYGLVLLGCATLAALVLARFIRLDGTGNNASPWNGTHRFPVDNLVWLFGSFAAGCCISYAATLRHQWQPGGFGGNTYLASGYYGGAYADPMAALDFLARGAWHLVASHLPLPWIVVFAIGFGVALVRLRVRFDVITVAAALAFAIAAVAGLLRVYPLIGGRYAMYLAPMLLVATTHATYQLVLRAANRPWVVHATMGLLAAVTVASGAVSIANGTAYAEKQDVKSILAVLEGRIQEGDVVYVAKGATAAVRFYAGTPSNYHFGETRWGRRNLVLNDGFAKDLAGVKPSNRLYIVNSHNALPDFRLLALFYEGIEVKRLVEGKGNTSLYVLEAPNLMDKLAAPANYRGVRGDPVIESAFDVYLANDMLLFVKERCRLDDIEPPFFVQALPANPDDPPVRIDQRSFPFIQTGVMMDGACAALVPLPTQSIDRVRVGQGAQSPQRGSARDLPLARKSPQRGSARDLPRARKNPLWSGEVVVDPTTATIAW